MPGRIRIIGGTWRSRKLDVVDAVDLRPTPDRVRETLFNWLQPYIEGAQCLDLYAGSGILGFEALSRGAATVVMIDNNAAVVKNLRTQAEKLAANGAEIASVDAFQIYRGLDIGTGKATQEEQKKVRHHLIDLVEADQDFSYEDVRLQLLKSGKAGIVQFRLYKCIERQT